MNPRQSWGFNNPGFCWLPGVRHKSGQPKVQKCQTILLTIGDCSILENWLHVKDNSRARDWYCVRTTRVALATRGVFTQYQSSVRELSNIAHRWGLLLAQHMTQIFKVIHNGDPHLWAMRFSGDLRRLVNCADRSKSPEGTQDKKDVDSFLVKMRFKFGSFRIYLGKGWCAKKEFVKHKCLGLNFWGMDVFGLCSAN